MSTIRKMRKTTRQKIGRGNPPKHSQFRKGISGNPKGRPKGSRNLSSYVLEAAHDPVTIKVGGKKRKISKIHATAMQLATKAALGNQAAINKFFDLIDEIETRAAAVKPNEYPLSAPDIEVIHAVYERMKECNPEKTEE
ncbi:MAG TPA: DUF5681 domain-containing protein [Xanthobacteraceae bacterium]|nr:DUF5681 domain-containing protein [Xanthobacteraceae bacterium]